jgi:hypothetical protein
MIEYRQDQEFELTFLKLILYMSDSTILSAQAKTAAVIHVIIM